MNLYGIYKRNTIDNVPEMNLYLIEYYDTELDVTDYTTVVANNEIDAMKYFIRSTHGTKIVVECDRLGGVKEN